MPPLILSPSFNSTGSVSAPPNLTISGTMNAASGFVWGTQGAIIDEYAAGNQIRMYTNTAGKGGWFYFPAGLTVNNSLYITGNSVLSASATDVYTTLQNSSTGGRTWHINATSNASGEGGGRFLIKDGTASATRLAIDSSGNVGIGTSSPTNLLHIAGETAQFPTSIYIAPTGHTTSRRAALSIDNWLLLQDIDGNGTKNFGIYQGAANALRLSISTSGNVGIGTSSPTATLDVVGTGKFSSTLTTSAGVVKKTASVLTGTTLDSTHHVVFATGSSNYTYTLPITTANAGREYVIKRYTSGTVSVTPNAADTIENGSAGAAFSIPAQYDSYTFISDGVSKWYII